VDPQLAAFVTPADRFDRDQLGMLAREPVQQVGELGVTVEAIEVMAGMGTGGAAPWSVGARPMTRQVAVWRGGASGGASAIGQGVRRRVRRYVSDWAGTRPRNPRAAQAVVE
jgi:hypothetical protein